jgi:hypothetical protein
MGELRKGFRKYEWRWLDKTNGIARRSCPQPLWMGGSDVTGRTIMLYGEQGLGDAIQFVRYAPLVASRGATVLLEVPKALVPLMQGLEGVSRVFGNGEELPVTDFHCPLLSLPLALGTTMETIPASIPYLSANRAAAARWHSKLTMASGKLVGLCWRGNPAHKGDLDRSIGLEEMSSLMKLPNVRFVSLQKDVNDDDVAKMKGMGIMDISSELNDFADTAAVVSILDLVISVDTSVVHLAGALGKPVWVLLPYVPDWRWLLKREDSPWYPTARLFRQPKARDWKVVVEKIRRKLAARTFAQH